MRNKRKGTGKEGEEKTDRQTDSKRDRQRSCWRDRKLTKVKEE